MKVSVDRSLAAEFFGSREDMDLVADSLVDLVGKLDSIAPGFAEIAPIRAAFAVDGTIVADWSQSLAGAGEVFLLARVGGGEGGELEYRALEPFGVEVRRDLSQPLSEAEADELRDLFRDHGLILARGQQLTMERQREICALFGPILLRKGENGYMTNEAGGASSSAYCWHSDAAYTKAPFDALALHALDVVDDASSTRFASAENVLDTLPAHLRRTLESSEQEMIAPHPDNLAERTCDQRDPFGFKRGTMPAIYVNPHNGRPCVWVNEMQTVRLLGMEWEESRDLLHEVYDCLYEPANTFEHRWRNGDIVIWDNIALQHARGNLDNVGNRLLQRVIVGTEGVVPFIDD